MRQYGSFPIQLAVYQRNEWDIGSNHAVVLLHVPDVLDVPHVPPPKCDFLINLDRMYSLFSHFQDLSKYDILVMVRVLDLTKTRTTLDKKMFLSRILWTVLPDTTSRYPDIAYGDPAKI
jgi:hypothetical protein